MKSPHPMLLAVLLVSSTAFADAIPYRAVARLLRSSCDAAAVDRIAQLDMVVNERLDTQVRELFAKHEVPLTATGILRAPLASRAALLAEAEALFPKTVEFVGAPAAGSKTAFTKSPWQTRYFDAAHQDAEFLTQMRNLRAEKVRVQVTYRTESGELVRSTGQLDRVSRSGSEKPVIELADSDFETQLIPIERIEVVHPFRDTETVGRYARLSLKSLKGQRARVVYWNEKTSKSAAFDGEVVRVRSSSTGESTIEFERVRKGETRRIVLPLDRIHSLEVIEQPAS